ncbi:SDR family NAD(P)-dependent oxidoreductase, partial [Pedobacter sp.]|uniref:SDR family NAD(P)-dependent oxidoreductase n=1 Tax=Pedobacter sp. TaxID=1411316 RepID=UPI003C3E60FD
MENKETITRRQAVAGLGLGIAGLAITPTFAAENLSAQGKDAAALIDPTTKYPRPPFNPQQQPFPGLASKMNPKPDHGELSYKGSGRLMGRKALITGGDSGMGRAAAIAFAREGADVVINYLPAEESDAREVIDLITKAGRKGYAIPGDLREESFCKRLVEDSVKKLGGLDIVVSNAARQQTKPSILEISTEDFDA